MHLKIKKRFRRALRRFFGLKRGQRAILGEALLQVRDRFEHPVLLETGCIRKADEGTDSTLLIASTMEGRGTFYTFELRPEHIEVCKAACGDYNGYINYVEGDSVTNLSKYVENGELAQVHFAYLDSMNDAEHTWREFKSIEPSFVAGAVLVVDDVLWADKGRRLRPFLEASGQWTSRVVNIENGMLIATRI